MAGNVRFAIDPQRATLLLARGWSVSDVARDQGVTRQAVYLAIASGRVKRPDQPKRK